LPSVNFVCEISVTAWGKKKFMRTICIFFRKPPRERTRMRWEDDIPMTLMKAGYEDRKLMQLAQDRVKQRTEITLSTSRESVSTTANEESKM